MPGPPGSGVTNPARGNRILLRQSAVTGDALTEPDFALLSETVTYVNRKVTTRQRPQCGMTNRYVTAANTGPSTTIDHTM
jgi:hypothetical protein